MAPVEASNNQQLIYNAKTPSIKAKALDTMNYTEVVGKPNEIPIKITNRPSTQNWEMAYNVNEIDNKVSAFTGTIQLILDKLLPKRTVRFHPSDKPWTTPRIKQEIKARQKAITSGTVASPAR